MVDEARILRLLRGITDDLAILRRESVADETRRADPIVHEYVEVSDDIVSARLGDLDDLEVFVEQVVAFITETSGSH
ncbi:hypothetical protein [Candidatus Mycobacterium methanotrophicum]|uniref:Uncharacterized protein n=1 Tax=Candidatus Mycobacterium methanotrophicum TaxID=2943498 RepID=A0ABY4QQQ5_9MYCO|nr:hypothetical protein [Candidatus Mycobacterium methanotrophicum]UQX12093.1 hypothetical protein M5I08_07155 [Candidatus Mycobacterium methanotrophicum]